jgi:hypothetical protein
MEGGAGVNKQFLVLVIQQAVVLAEMLLGSGKGEKKKEMASKYVENIYVRTAPLLPEPSIYGQAEKDFTNWMIDNIVAANNESGTFKTAGKTVGAGAEGEPSRVRR